MKSLRYRAMLGGVVWALVSVAVGGLALLSIFDTVANRRFDELLLERHLQVLVALANSEAEPDLMEVLLPDPAYARPYSGRYWQVDGADGTIMTSRSLFDSSLDNPPEVPDEPAFWTGDGPDGPVRGVRQRIALEDRGDWIVSVAETLSSLNAERAEMRRSVTLALAFVGALGVFGAALLTTAVVRPLTKLREDVMHRWDAGRALEVEGYPTEVAPLVSDINTLLDRNREVLDRARRQAADLAHALKTPSAALRNEIEALDPSQGRAALEALDRIDAQIGRSLARMRASHGASAVRLQTDLARSVERLTRLFRSMRETSGKEIATAVPAGLGVAMDAQDLEETLGNLLENGVKWARSRIRLAAVRESGMVRITIDDDGPGIPEERRRAALTAGGRLDTAVPGTGLGLAIASDLVDAYGGTLDLDRSADLGGLSVVVRVPFAALGD